MSDIIADTVIGAYRLAGRAAVPLMPIALSWRARRGKEDRARLGERFGRASLPRPTGRLAWIHAASVGETNAIMPLVERVTASGLAVVFTSVTVTSADIAARRLPRGACHQFAPLDAPPLVGRFLDHWRPDLALFVESELWPTTIIKLATAGIPQVLVNARLSERSFRGWRRLGGVARAIFGRIPLCLAQSEQDADRYLALGAPRALVTGNLKFDAPAPDVDADTLAGFSEAVAGRPIWIAASTHPGEEAAAGEVHRLLRDRFRGLLTMIVPRHPSRGEAIRGELDAAGLRTAQRSRGEAIDATTEVYLADTLGELGLFYRVALIAFLGGSLVPHGGQNPIEPIRLGCAVLHGTHVHNFAEVYATIDGLGDAPPITDAASLAEAVAGLLDDSSARERLVRQADEALAPFSGALAATMAALVPYLETGKGS
jgi:3-deoxy-D-manno-octulosonic-acid transferase